MSKAGFTLKRRRGKRKRQAPPPRAPEAEALAHPEATSSVSVVRAPGHGRHRAGKVAIPARRATSKPPASGSVGRADCHPPCAGQRLSHPHADPVPALTAIPARLGHADDRCVQVAVPRRSIGAQHRQTHRSHACHLPCARSTVVSNAPGNVRRIAIPARRGHGAGGEKPRAAIKLAVPARRAWSQNARSRLPPRRCERANLCILPDYSP